MQTNDQRNYLKAVVIVHGKSEQQLCQFITSNLRLPIKIYRDKKSSIEITSILNHLKNKVFGDSKGFISTYFKGFDIKKLPEDFKIFIVMDVDNCTNQQKVMFINKAMFKDHWAYNHIVPIYNDRDLESVLTHAGIKFTKKGNERKREYIKIFPTDSKYIKSDTLQVQELSKNLRKNENTNLNEFLDFCLAIS